jgi:predicted nucleic acid-binding protein
MRIAAMAPVYFDTSVFIALLSGSAAEGPPIRALLRELKKDRVRIYTSIITVQEVSVLSFRRGSVFTDNHVKVAKLARIVGITKDIALTAAKYEAAVVEVVKKSGGGDGENHRRKWDCFHMATGVAMGCRTIYTLDDQFAAKRRQLGLESVLTVSKPVPHAPPLVSDLYSGKD